MPTKTNVWVAHDVVHGCCWNRQTRHKITDCNIKDVAMYIRNNHDIIEKMILGIHVFKVKDWSYSPLSTILLSEYSMNVFLLPVDGQGQYTL